MRLPHGTVIAVTSACRFDLFVNDGDEVIMAIRRVDASTAAPPRPHLATRRILQRDAFNRRDRSRGAPGAMVLDAPESRDAMAGRLVRTVSAMLFERRARHLLVLGDAGWVSDLRRHYTRLVRRALLAEIAVGDFDPISMQVLRLLERLPALDREQPASRADALSSLQG